MIKPRERDQYDQAIEQGLAEKTIELWKFDRTGSGTHLNLIGNRMIANNSGGYVSVIENGK